MYFCFFFFSSRRRHTRWPRDWSSDVCSSDLFHPLIAQRPKARAELVVKVRSARLIDAELRHGNARVGKDVLEHRPAAVVEAPGVIGGDRERREEALNACGELGISVGRIAHLVELAREAAEVVNG